MSWWRPGTAASVLGFMLAAAAAQGAAPVLDHLYPAGARRGSTNIITAVGKQDPWPVDVWTDDAGIQFKAEKDKGKFTVIVSPQAKLGPHLVRLHNAEGASTVRYFIVTDTLEAEEKENNDDLAKPQVVENLPAVVNGRLEKNGDVDSFAVKLNAGQWLIASLDAYVLGSTMDGMLRLTDTNGVQLAYNHDGNFSFDPFLRWQAPASGTYIVQVMGFAYPANASISFDGGSTDVYRLSLTTGPYVSHAFPTGVNRSKSTKVAVFGWNLPENMETTLATENLPGSAAQVSLKTETFNSISLPLSAEPEQMEQEPNDEAAAPQPLTLPGHVSGRIQIVGDQDRYQFEAKKGQKWQVAVQADELGFPLDATLRIEDAAGKELAKNDDAKNSSDPSLIWTVPADGKFTAVISSLMRQGGSNCIYRLSVTEPRPAYRATVAANSFTISPGKTNEIKATITRINGHDRPLTFSAAGLPPGVSLTAGEVPAKTGDVTLKLIARADAKPFSGPFTIAVQEAGSNATQTIAHELISRGIDNGVPQGYTRLVIEQVEKLWLTVKP